MPSALRLVPLAVLALVGCERGALPGQAVVDFRHTRAPGGTPVASWTGDRVTAEELRRLLEEMSPALRERYQTLEQKREYVEGLVRYELLVREALARGLQDDPDVVAGTKRALVSRLMRDELEGAAQRVSEEDVAAAYARQREDYVRPEQVRLSHIFLAAPRADAARVAAARREAEALRAQARALPARDFAAFGRLARAHSQEPRTQPLDGDLRFRSLEVLAQDLGPEVADAARALVAEGVGALSGVVQTDAGLHVLRLTGHQPALDQSLADVRERIAGRLAQERRSRAWEELLAGLATRADVTLDTAALARVHVDALTPPRAPTLPAPGSLPAPPSPPSETP
ncbi:peptidylprolyl isomerase [Archangium primigenium]|uniref:peptidylprolyl isomerase n=1 Tax=[Archangium] primigenium TaxID=2792470 RepID=UPI00195E4131|nr:peptidylprolyl isomerase [Archangium primigenium]MBM7111924.1 peptidyl-prolyl cis-trans isomerase [Archangium primigenium]